MFNLTKNFHPIDYACFALIAAIGMLAVGFVWMDTLGAYSDDSVSYVILAQAMSPYFDTHAVITEAAKLERYPPLFSLFLALSGVSHSYLASHIVVALMFTAALGLSYWLAVRILTERRLALLTTLLFALSPGVWLNMLGILSENMYIVLSLGALLLFSQRPSVQLNTQSFPSQSTSIDNLWAIQITVLLVMVMLCRSLGIALVAAFGIVYFLQHKPANVLTDWRFWLPVLTPLISAAVWASTRDSASQDLYATDVSNIFTQIINSPTPIQHFVTALSPQLSSLYESWHTIFELYWKDNYQPSHIVFTLFALCTLAGLGLRLTENQIDAWYVLFYLLILLVWPYPGQFNRFIYVLIPLFIIQGLYFITWLLKKYAADKTILISSLIMMVLFASVAPTSAFIIGRATYTTPYDDMDFSHVAPFYNVPDINSAKRVAYRHEHLRQDLEKLNASLDPEATIMWYTPNYINLVAQRKSVRFPSTKSSREFLQQVKDSRADYVFASGLNPRYTSESFNGLQVIKHFKDFTELVWKRNLPDSNLTGSILLKIDQRRLADLIEKTSS